MCWLQFQGLAKAKVQCGTKMFCENFCDVNFDHYYRINIGELWL